MLQRCKFFVAAFALAFLVTNSTQAGVMYGVTGAGGAASSLYTIDTTTGAATLVGATGFSHMTGLDFDPTTGVLYGLVDSGFVGTPSLVTVDKNTGAATLIGSLGAGFAAIPDISFNSLGQLYGWTESSDGLITIDKLTGAATLIGSDVGTFQTGLAFDSSDALFLKVGAFLHSIDPTTGFSLGFTFLSGTSPDPVNALEFDPDNGTLYTITGSGGGGGRSSFLATIDQGAGTWTNIGDMGVLNMSAIAIESTVPEPTAWTVFVGLSLIGGIASWRGRRSRANS